MAEGRGMPQGGQPSTTYNENTTGDTLTISIGKSVNTVIGNNSKLVVYSGPKSHRHRKKKHIPAKYPMTVSIEPVTTNEKLELKGKIGKHWKELGTRLGFEDAEIEQIEVDSHTDVSERVYQIISKWQQREADCATKTALAKVFMKMKRGDLADILAVAAKS